MSGKRLAVSSTAYYDELYGLAAMDADKENAKVPFGGGDKASGIVLNHVDNTKFFYKNKKEEESLKVSLTFEG